MAVEASPVALWVIGVGEVAGVGRHALDVASTGVPGWSLCFLVPDGPLREELQSQGLAVATQTGFGPEHGPLRSRQAVGQALCASGAALVHSHLAWADIVVAAAPSPGIRVSTEHGIAGDPSTYSTNAADQRLMALVHRWRMRRTRGLFAVSGATAGLVTSRWHPPRGMELVVLPNGIDRAKTAMSRSARRSGGVIGYLGRFSAEKRVHLVVDAFAEASRRRPGLRLRLAGAGAEEGALRAQVGRLGLADRVDFDGWVDPRVWLDEIDVLAVASLWENCSYSILEAVVAGVGVVASPVGGNPEILPMASLADPTDADAFAGALIRQLLAPTSRPVLPEWIPSRAGMCEVMAGAYRRWAMGEA